MVKIDFICEGHTEKILIESEKFKNYIKKSGCQIGRIINAEGEGNIHKEILNWTDADCVFILTDLDNDNCPRETIDRHVKRAKKRSKSYKKTENHIFIIAIKEIESWFLSDKQALKKIKINFNQNAEDLSKPKEKIKRLLNKNKKRKLPISETIIANKFIEEGKFSIENAANNQYCTSAKYFIKKLNDCCK